MGSKYKLDPKGVSARHIESFKCLRQARASLSASDRLTKKEINRMGADAFIGGRSSDSISVRLMDERWPSVASGKAASVGEDFDDSDFAGQESQPNSLEGVPSQVSQSLSSRPESVSTPSSSIVLESAPLGPFSSAAVSQSPRSEFICNDMILIKKMKKICLLRCAETHLEF